MSKKIEIHLTMVEIKTLIDALAQQKKDYFSPLFDKLDEIYDNNKEPHALTSEEWHEKYGCEE